MYQAVLNVFHQHSYLVLFLSLLLELVALPFPGELLMGLAGFWVFQGKISYLGAITAAGLGAALGITVSYVVGYLLGMPFFRKYGKYVHFGPEKLDRTSQWFTVHGNKLLSIAYFIPGVRHFTGYFAGVVRIPFRSFAIYAYLGAFLWTGTFVTIGKLLGPQWEKVHGLISRYLLFGFGALCMLMIIVFLCKKYHDDLVRLSMNLVHRARLASNALGGKKTIAVWSLLIFIGFSLLTIGLIQEFFAVELEQF